MRTALFAVVATLTIAALACADEPASGLPSAPQAQVVQVACLDASGDMVIDAADAAEPALLTDFDADGRRDDLDAAFIDEVVIHLDPVATRELCDSEDDPGAAPDYLVAHEEGEPAVVSCEGAEHPPVLLTGIGGGDVDVTDLDAAAGVRQALDTLREALTGRSVETIAIATAPGVAGARNRHVAMEDWLTHAMRVYLDRYPCLRLVLVGHSHGAVTTDVVAARLEDNYADRILAVVNMDRIDDLYVGDTQTRPGTAFVFNIYQTNDGAFPGQPFDSPNAENWDATGVEDDDGKPVTHTTLDNASAVHERIVDVVLERSGLAGGP